VTLREGKRGVLPALLLVKDRIVAAGMSVEFPFRFVPITCCHGNAGPKTSFTIEKIAHRLGHLFHSPKFALQDSQRPSLEIASSSPEIQMPARRIARGFVQNDVSDDTNACEHTVTPYPPRHQVFRRA
jgi:hypothetical protein